jgi:DNA-directed RNA polymerase subunit RPC12/RpoP
MAARTDFTCSHCGFKVEAWDDGNCYLTDSEGKRHFFYHPGDYGQTREFYQQQTGCAEVREDDYLAFWRERGGNEWDLICMHCGRQTRRDPKRDPMRCTGCGKRKLKDTNRLDGQTCPKCAKGTFHGEMGAIS